MHRIMQLNKYYKTLIFRVHLIFVNFASNIKSRNYPQKFKKFKLSMNKLCLHTISILLVNIFCSELAYYCTSLQTVMHNSVHMAKVTWNFTVLSTPRENAKLKCSEISILQNRQIRMQLKYSVLQYGIFTGAYVEGGQTGARAP